MDGEGRDAQGLFTQATSVVRQVLRKSRCSVHMWQHRYTWCVCVLSALALAVRTRMDVKEAQCVWLLNRHRKKTARNTLLIESTWSQCPVSSHWLALVYSEWRCQIPCCHSEIAATGKGISSRWRVAAMPQSRVYCATEVTRVNRA